MPVTLTRKIASTVGIAEVVPVRRKAEGVEPLASGHWPMQALTRADGWVLVPAGERRLCAGRAARDAGVPMNDAGRTRPDVALARRRAGGGAAGAVPRSRLGRGGEGALREAASISRRLPPKPCRLPRRSAACSRMTSRRRSTCRRSTAPMWTASRCAPPTRRAPTTARRAASRSTPRCSPAAMRRHSPLRPAPRPRLRPAASCRAAPTPS